MSAIKRPCPTSFTALTNVHLAAAIYKTLVPTSWLRPTLIYQHIITGSPWMEHDSSPDRASHSHADRVAPSRLSATLSPPYWQHQRSLSSATQASLERPSGITLEDNTQPDSPSQSTLWAKSIAIDDYVVVRGNITGLGDYVVWNCKVQTLDGGPMMIRKRYSEFEALRHELVTTFPQSTKKSLPPLPPKSAIYKFRPRFLEKRRQGLAYFLNCVMLNPEYAGSHAVKNFLFD